MFIWVCISLTVPRKHTICTFCKILRRNDCPEGPDSYLPKLLRFQLESEANQAVCAVDFIFTKSVRKCRNVLNRVNMIYFWNYRPWSEMPFNSPSAEFPKGMHVMCKRYVTTVTKLRCCLHATKPFREPWNRCLQVILIQSMGVGCVPESLG